MLGLTSRVSDSVGVGGCQKCAFLMCFLGMLLLLARGPGFENLGTGPYRFLEDSSYLSVFHTFLRNHISPFPARHSLGCSGRWTRLLFPESLLDMGEASIFQWPRLVLLRDSISSRDLLTSRTPLILNRDKCLQRKMGRENGEA